MSSLSTTYSEASSQNVSSPAATRKVLYIALAFAPVCRTGSFRTIHFVRHLRQFGVEPVVLTLEAAPAAEAFSVHLDEGLNDLLPENLEVHRAPFSPPKKYDNNKILKSLSIFTRIDSPVARAARSTLLKKADHIIAQHQFDAIVVTQPPFGTGLIASEIATKHKLPLIVDMRDAWADWCVGAYPSYLHYHLTRKNEVKLFERADKVVAVTSPLRDLFARRHPKSAPSKFRLIHNGYSESLPLDKLEKLQYRPKEKLKIGYVGRYYFTPSEYEASRTPWWKKRGHRMLQYVPLKQDWLYRSPYFLFEAIAKLVQANPEFKNRIEYHHVGNEPSWLPEMVESFGLKDSYFAHGRVSQTKLIDHLQQFDVLFCTSEKVDDGKAYCIGSKSFDYLRAAKPILGVVAEGAQKDFLSQCGVAITTNPDIPTDTVNQLRSLLNNGWTGSVNKAFLEGFHRKSLTKDLAEVIDEAIAEFKAAHPRG